MKISLVGPSYTLQSVVAAAQQTINWYPESLAVQDEPRRQVLFGRPGLKFFAQLTPTKIRCLWSGGGRLFAVHAANLSEISEAGAITTQPTVMFQGTGNPDPAQIFSNGHQLMIITGGLVYIDNGTGPQPARFAESGTASTTATVGNNVHRLTGPPFNPATMSSRTMRMNGNFYVVNAVIDANNITVSPTPTASPETVWSIDSGANVDAVTGGFLDGYFIVNRTRSANPALQAQGRTFNISALNDGTFWDPLDFAVKEGYSDYIQSILCDHEELILFGTETTEVWTNIGSTVDASGVASFPFQRMQGAFNNDGSAAIYAPCSVGPYRCWLGSGTNGQTVAYRALAFNPERISTHAQESNWNAPSFNVKDAVSYAYLDDGHLFWVINFWQQQQTWVYDMSEGLWHERAAWVPASSTFARYQPWFHAFIPEWGIGGKHIVGDPATGKLYEQSLNFYDDDGVAIEYIRSFPHLLNEDKNMFHHRIEFYLETGAVTGVVPEMQIGLDWSDDRGHTFKTGLAPLQSSGIAGDYRKRIVWRRLGRSRDRVYRFGVQGKGKVCLTDAFLEATPRRVLMPDLIVPPFRTALLSANGKSLTAIEGAGAPQDGRITIETTREWWLFWRMLAEFGNAGLLMITFGVHADRPVADGMPDGAIYVESDRSGVIYQNQGGEWHYLAGTMWGTLSPDQRPTDLGVNDAGFDFRSTDPPPREYIWSGTAWADATPFLDPTTTKGDLIARGTAAPATRLGVGTNGQVLTADSAQALGVKWGTPASAGMADPTTTLGDLIVRGAAAPATRLPVGANGQALLADSAQPLGVRWGAAASAQIANASASLTLTTSFQDVAGATLTLPKTGTYLIHGVFDFVGQGAGDSGANFLGQLVANGSAQTGFATFRAEFAAAARGTVTQQWMYTAGTVNQVVQLQANKGSGTGTSIAAATHTRISALWVAP